MPEATLVPGTCSPHCTTRKRRLCENDRHAARATEDETPATEPPEPRALLTGKVGVGRLSRRAAGPERSSHHKTTVRPALGPLGKIPRLGAILVSTWPGGCWQNWGPGRWLLTLAWLMAV